MVKVDEVVIQRVFLIEPVWFPVNQDENSVNSVWSVLQMSVLGPVDQVELVELVSEALHEVDVFDLLPS